MTAAVGKRSTMTLYSSDNDLYSHRCRIVLAEKGVTVDVVRVDPFKKPEGLQQLNPYNQVPVLLDRELVLYESSLIMEYLDERFPHPPLMPVYPVARARSRLMLHRIEKDWYSLADKIAAAGLTTDKTPMREQLAQGLCKLAPVFAESTFFLSDEYNLLDCSLSVLLWRADWLGLDFGPQTAVIKAYAKRMFERESFQASLTEAEREIGGIF